MSGRPVKKGTTNVSSVVRIIDSSDGTPETGVVAATGGLAFNYRREAEAAVAITGINDLALLTTAHTDGGILHIGDGYYRIDFQDAAFAAGAGEDGVLLTGTATGMIVIGTYHPLVDYDPYDTIRMGLTALPAAAADAANGLPISIAGSLDLDAMNTNINDIETDTAAMQPLVAKIPLSDGTISWNATALGDINTQCDLALTDYDGPTDAEMIARTIVSASYFNPATDTVATVTNLTNLPAIPANWLTAAGIAADAITEAKLANDSISARQLATNAVEEIRDAILSDSTPFAGADIQSPLVKGTADTGTTTSVTDSFGLSQADDDYWNGCWVRFTSGNIVGQTRLITDFDEFVNRITFAPPLTQPVTTQTYEIWQAAATGVDWGLVLRPTTVVDLSATDVQLCDTITTYTGNTVQTGDNFARIGAPVGASISADLADIETRLPAALVGGLMSSDVTAISTSTVAADNLEAHALETLSVTFTTSGGSTTAAVLNMVNGGAASSTNDVYIGRVLVFNNGTLDHQITEITAYVGSTKTATITAITAAPTASHTARMI